MQCLEINLHRHSWFLIKAPRQLDVKIKSLQPMPLEKLDVCGGALNRIPLSIPHQAKAQRTLRKKRQKGLRARGWGDVLWNATFWIWHSYHTRELREAVASCTRSQQTKVQHRWDGGPLTPYWELLAMHSCWGRKKHSSQSLYQQGGFSCSSGRPYTHAHMGGTN